MRVARGGGGGGFFVVQPFPWDHEQSCCHHELSHGLMVKSKKTFPPCSKRGTHGDVEYGPSHDGKFNNKTVCSMVLC